jgi:hypothetical protein
MGAETEATHGLVEVEKDLERTQGMFSITVLTSTYWGC